MSDLAFRYTLGEVAQQEGEGLTLREGEETGGWVGQSVEPASQWSQLEDRVGQSAEPAGGQSGLVSGASWCALMA